MKSLMLGAVIAVVSSNLAYAQSAQQRYQGTFFVTAAENCEGVEAATVGRDYVFVFRTQSDLQRLSITGLPYAVSFEPRPDPSRFAASGNFRATRIGSGADATSFNGRYSAFSTSPASFAEGTESVLVKGTIRNFDGEQGCTVEFRAAGARRPN